VDVFGLPFALADYQSTFAHLVKLSERSAPGSAAFCATHLLAEAKMHEDFHQTLASFDARFPDGMPVVWLMNALGGRMRDRVYGPYLMRYAIQHAPRPYRHFLFGGSPECLSELEIALRKLQPQVEVVGKLSPPFRAWNEEDEAGFAQAIGAADPDFVWVALGGIKQERWIVRNRHRYRRGVFLAVGDAFELLAGRRTFAPAWMQRLGLTWVYRLVQEPRRLWKRYLIYNSVFATYAILEVLRALFTGRPRRA
jgi:N-acetylglucosaminyldiphosphoundecaprenol N-acetyl-beta-D-mannosaminyltransferase